MIFIDSHTHIYLEEFDNDRQTVVDRAIEEGIKYMLLPSIDKSTFDSMKRLVDDNPQNCIPMIGLHPTSVKDKYKEELKFVEAQLMENKYCAVGEIGIDLYWDKTFAEEQKYSFRHQINLAKENNLAIAIHTRDSFDEVYEIVKEEQDGNLKGVFHCFTGDLEVAKKIMDLNFYMGIGGIVTFKNSGQDKVVKDIPLESILLETDSPFLTPAPYRGKRNESAYIRLIANKIAEIKEVDLDTVAKQTTYNSINLFNIEE
ncbi:MAG: hydrolase TatD [Marinilabiliales bacterium]|nr:MAG: hydrolase TatD [Marinilabiliales bacterium]